ncbi:MAG: hypothetical protein AAF226_15540 [Verrucomicrobiota bacterium]
MKVYSKIIFLSGLGLILVTGLWLGNLTWKWREYRAADGAVGGHYRVSDEDFDNIKFWTARFHWMPTDLFEAQYAQQIEKD